MDAESLETLIRVVTLESQSDPSQKAQATLYIEQVKAAQNRYSIGLQLLYAARSHLTQFFGLALLRDFLASIAHIAAIPTDQDISIRKGIRDSLLEWTRKNCNDNVNSETVPAYMWNSVCTCITLVIKNDFPERWPDAFNELLQFGRGGYGYKGAELVLSTLTELEVEVVVFNESRSKQEITHNSLIKDAMRNMNIAKRNTLRLRTPPQQDSSKLGHITTAPQQAS